MPPPPHLRITFSGVLGPDTGPTEIWACNLSASLGANEGPEAGAGVAGLENVAQGLYAPLSVFVVGQCSAQVRLDRVRVAVVDSEGLVMRTDSGQYYQGDEDERVRAAGSSLKPFQTALAISLQSLYAGPTGRGRFYLPCPQASVGADGRIATSVLAPIATNAATMLDAVNQTLSGTWSASSRVVVASGGSAARGIPPALHDVVAVSVGDVMDTQQRRRRDLVEQREERAVA